MNFNKYVEEILQKEVSNIIGQQGYFLETEFCTNICDRYKLSVSTVQSKLRKVYPAMDLVKRHITNEMKRFYDLEIKGYPIVYMMNKK